MRYLKLYERHSNMIEYINTIEFSLILGIGYLLYLEKVNPNTMNDNEEHYYFCDDILEVKSFLEINTNLVL